MTEVDQPCNNKKWRYCMLDNNGVCANCERGRASVMLCGNKDFRVCEFKVSKSFSDGVCINCGRVSSSVETVMKKMFSEIDLYSDNFELFFDLADLIRNNNIELPISDIRKICQHWYKKSKATRDRLDSADELFKILDHANSGLASPFNITRNEPLVSFGYKDNDNEVEDYE